MINSWPALIFIIHQYVYIESIDDLDGHRYDKSNSTCIRINKFSKTQTNEFSIGNFYVDFPFTHFVFCSSADMNCAILQLFSISRTDISKMLIAAINFELFTIVITNAVGNIIYSNCIWKKIEFLIENGYENLFERYLNT